MRGFLQITLVVLLATLFIQAQTFRGAINGTVVDPSGAVVAGADVKAINNGTGVTLSSVSTSEGQFAFQDRQGQGVDLAGEGQHQETGAVLRPARRERRGPGGNRGRGGHGFGRPSAPARGPAAQRVINDGVLIPKPPEGKRPIPRRRAGRCRRSAAPCSTRTCGLSTTLGGVADLRTRGGTMTDRRYP